MVVTYLLRRLCSFEEGTHMFLHTGKNIRTWVHAPKHKNTMEYSQVERHRFLIPTCKGSNPFTPNISNVLFKQLFCEACFCSKISFSKKTLRKTSPFSKGALRVKKEHILRSHHKRKFFLRKCTRQKRSSESFLDFQSERSLDSQCERPLGFLIRAPPWISNPSAPLDF